MQKFYIHRTALAYVTEVVEINAKDEADAMRIAVRDGEGRSLGIACGDYYNGGPDEEIEIFPAELHNIPVGFLPFNEWPTTESDAD